MKKIVCCLLSLIIAICFCSSNVLVARELELASVIDSNNLIFDYSVTESGERIVVFNEDGVYLASFDVFSIEEFDTPVYLVETASKPLAGCNSLSTCDVWTAWKLKKKVGVKVDWAAGVGKGALGAIIKALILGGPLTLFGVALSSIISVAVDHIWQWGKGNTYYFYQYERANKYCNILFQTKGGVSKTSTSKVYLGSTATKWTGSIADCSGNVSSACKILAKKY